MNDLPPARLSQLLTMSMSTIPALSGADSTASLPTRVQKPRLGVVDTVYYQAPNEQPISADSRFGRWLSSDEQPYGPRVVKIEPGRHKLDHGWLESASMMLIENRGDEIIELWLADTHLCDIPAKESARLPNPNLDELYVANVTAGKYAITIIPE